MNSACFPFLMAFSASINCFLDFFRESCDGVDVVCAEYGGGCVIADCNPEASVCGYDGSGRESCNAVLVLVSPVEGINMANSNTRKRPGIVREDLIAEWPIFCIQYLFKCDGLL